MRLVASTAAVLFGVPLLALGSSVTSPALTINNNHKTAHASIARSNAPTPPPAVATPQPDTVVTVQSGDNLTKIADANSSTALRVFYANTSIQKPDLIYPGEQLRIPTADEQLAARPVPADTQVQTPADTPAPAPAAPQTTEAASYTAPQPQPVAVATSATNTSAWDRLAACESSGNWAANTGNGFYGGLQFTLSSWEAVGGTGLPSNASKAEQIARAQMLQARQGWGAWPVCSVKVGLR